MSEVEVLTSGAQSVKGIIIILFLIFLIIIGCIIFFSIIIRSRHKFSGSFKHGNTEAKVEFDKSEKNEIKTESKRNEGNNKIIENQDFDFNKLLVHRFFTSTLNKFTSDNCIFELYDETVKMGIKKDTEEISSFKKLIASRYLNNCLFKVLGDNTREWINDLVKEMKGSPDKNKVPDTFYTISQYITKYKKAAYKEGKLIEFEFNDRKFYGIPTKFMKKFNSWSDIRMNKVYTMISDVVYSTQNTWFAKTIELLDLFEVVFMMLHDQMDATLIILNGEIELFLRELSANKEKDFDEIN
jgi:hypothetical protein